MKITIDQRTFFGLKALKSIKRLNYPRQKLFSSTGHFKRLRNGRNSRMHHAKTAHKYSSPAKKRPTKRHMCGFFLRPPRGSFFKRAAQEDKVPDDSLPQ
jgi:hypothetical protein